MHPKHVKLLYKVEKGNLLLDKCPGAPPGHTTASRTHHRIQPCSRPQLNVLEQCAACASFHGAPSVEGYHGGAFVTLMDQAGRDYDSQGLTFELD